MFIDFLTKTFASNKQKDCIIWRDHVVRYEWLLNRIGHWTTAISSQLTSQGTVMALEADFSPDSIALFLSLLERGCVIVPLTSSVERQKEEFTSVAQAEVLFSLSEDEKLTCKQLPYRPDHPIYTALRRLGHPGLVLLSSGSTGKSKAAVHDFVPLLAKFTVPRHCLRTITFLLYDHIGGLNTMLYVLSNAGCIVTVTDRTPDGVLSLVEKHKVELLPTSPTFLNLVLLSEAYKKYDLSSLKVVTYGTEPMPHSTLQRFHQLFPGIRLLQTYGLSELGILRSKSKSSNSLWVKVGGEGFETRVVDGVLQIKAQSAMMGYLNSPSPFTDDGWFDTGDCVEQEGEYIRILGRKTQIINVGGQKVYPSEVENTIQELDNVADVTVYGEPNAVVGNIVCARVSLLEEEELRSFTIRLRKHCQKKLELYKVPIKVQLVNGTQYTSRFKKSRPLASDLTP